MRWFMGMVAVLALSGSLEAREPLARPMERTPSIMVEESDRRPAKAKRAKAVRPRADRNRPAQVTRTRPVVVPRASAVFETESRSINSAIGRQLQQTQSEQNQQVDINLFRQQIQRSTNSSIGLQPLGCNPGSLRC